MTTEVKIAVPETANYDVHIVVEVGHQGGFEHHYVSPGDTFSTYIYGGREIILIRELPHGSGG